MWQAPGRVLRDVVPALETEGELVLGPGDREALLCISSATIDRRLKQAGKVARPRGDNDDQAGQPAQESDTDQDVHSLG